MLRRFGQITFRVLAHTNRQRKKAGEVGVMAMGATSPSLSGAQVQGSPMVGENHVTTIKRTFTDQAVLRANQSRPGTTVVSFDGPGLIPAAAGWLRSTGEQDCSAVGLAITRAPRVSFHAAVELESAAIEARTTEGPCQANKRVGHHRTGCGGQSDDGLARSAIPARSEG